MLPYIRRYLAKKILKQLKYQAWIDKINNSATKIQCLLRKRVARKFVNALRHRLHQEQQARSKGHHICIQYPSSVHA